MKTSIRRIKISRARREKHFQEKSHPFSENLHISQAILEGDFSLRTNVNA